MHVSVTLQDGTSMEVEGDPEELFEFLTRFGVGSRHRTAAQSRLTAVTGEADADGDADGVESDEASVTGSSDRDPPSTETLADFIKRQQNYQHSLQSVIRQYVGEEISSRDEDGEQNRLYNRWAKRISRARENVSDDEGIEWVHEWRDGEKWFEAEDED